eukprot:SAG31_NODE_24299_length_484_cov_3.929870_1_plen_72_part_10
MALAATTDSDRMLKFMEEAAREALFRSELHAPSPVWYLGGGGTAQTRGGLGGWGTSNRQSECVDNTCEDSID